MKKMRTILMAIMAYGTSLYAQTEDAGLFAPAIAFGNEGFGLKATLQVHPNDKLGVYFGLEFFKKAPIGIEGGVRYSLPRGNFLFQPGIGIGANYRAGFRAAHQQLVKESTFGQPSFVFLIKPSIRVVLRGLFLQLSLNDGISIPTKGANSANARWYFVPEAGVGYTF